MKILFDFFPIALFFVIYKFYNIYYATGIMIAASILQTGFYWFKERKLEITHLITLGIVIILGAATIWFRNDYFIKWKPTVVYWVFAFLFVVFRIFKRKNLIELLMAGKVSLPHKAWYALNTSWMLFFIFMGIANLYVAYNFSTDTWVNFKLFGGLGATTIFIIFQSIYMAKHLKSN